MKTAEVPSKEIGNRIHNLRDFNQFTREELANKVSISSKFLYEIETGKKGFSVDILYRLSKIFGVSCDYIMFGTTDDKVSAKIRGLLEQFDARQMVNLQVIMETILKMNQK